MSGSLNFLFYFLRLFSSRLFLGAGSTTYHMAFLGTGFQDVWNGDLFLNGVFYEGDGCLLWRLVGGSRHSSQSKNEMLSSRGFLFLTVTT